MSNRAVGPVSAHTRFLAPLGLLGVFFLSWGAQEAASGVVQPSELQNIPPRNALYVKRDRLTKQIEMALSAKENLGPVTLVGMAGIGKTQLAREYAQNYGGNYNIVWWMDGNQELLPQLRELGQKLNSFKGCPMPNLKERSHRKWIEEISACCGHYFPRVLFVIDDVKDKDSTQQITEELTEKLKNVRILLTSRNQFMEGKLMTLRSFTREESIEYLKTLLPQVPYHSLGALAKKLNDYPLALSQATSYIKALPSLTVEEYIVLYDEKRKTLWEKEELLNASELYHQTVATTFTLLLDQLQKTHPQALEILKLTSFLGSQDIPKRFLKRWVIDHKSYDEFEFHEALSVLLKTSLFDLSKRINTDVKDEKYSIHSTLHEFVRDQLSKKDQKKYLGEAASLLLSYLQGSSYHLWKNLFHDRFLEFHLKFLLNTAESYKMKSNDLLNLKLKYINFLFFFNSDYQNTKEKIQELEPVILNNPTFPLLDKARFLIILGNAATLQKSYDDAILISEQAEQILSTINKLEAKEDLFFLLVNNLMDFYNTKGNLKKAEEAGKKAELLLPHIRSPFFLTLYYFMHSLLFLNKGDYVPALGSVEMAIQKCSDAEFPEHFHIFTKIIKAEILARSGQLEEALRLVNHNVKEFKKNYPNESNFKPLRMDAVRSYIYLKQGQLEEASTLIRNTIQGLDTLFKKDDENPVQGFSHIILGEIYEKQGNLLSALKEYRQAEEIYTHIFKTIEVDDVSYLYRNLVVLGEKMKDDFLSQEYVELLMNHFGLDHPKTIESLQYLDEHKVSVF